MGGNVEAYEDAKREREEKARRIQALLEGHGLESTPPGTVLVVENRTNQRVEYAFGADGRTLHWTTTIRIDDVANLLKALGHRVRRVNIED